MPRIESLQSVEIEGCFGVSLDKPMLLNDLGQRNIFIGPNNAGKSLLFRILRDVVERLEAGYGGHMTRQEAQLNYFWGFQFNNSIRSPIAAATLPSGSRSQYCPF